MEQKRKRGYISPQCKTVQTETEQLCVISVRPNAGASTFQNPWYYDDKGTHDVGYAVIGDISGIAPAKDGIWDSNEEE